MNYQTSSALSVESKSLISAILQNDKDFTGFLTKRFYPFHEKEILFFMRDNFDAKENNSQDFIKTLNALSFTSPHFNQHSQLLLEIISNQPTLAETASKILYENKNSFADATIISSLLEAYASGNLADEYFKSFSQVIIKNNTPEGILGSEIIEYATENGHDKAVKKFTEFQMSSKNQGASTLSYLFEQYTDLEKDCKSKNIFNYRELVQYVDVLITRREMKDTIYTNKEKKDYTSALQQLLHKKRPVKIDFSTTYDVMMDLVELSVQYPHLEKSIRQFLTPIKNDLNNTSALNDIINISVKNPRMINFFLDSIKKANKSSAYVLSDLPTAAYFNKKYKSDFLNTAAKSIRNSCLFISASPIFKNVGLAVDQSSGKQVHLNLFDENYQYLAKTALYESKMPPPEAAALGETIRMMMENKIAQEYLSDEADSNEVQIFDQFVKMAIKSPLINQDKQIKNTFIASLYFAEQTVAFPPEARENIQKTLEKYDFSNGGFLKALVKKTIIYEKKYNDEINRISPFEAYENTFNLIEKSIEENKLNKQEKSAIYQSLSEIEKHESYNKEKFIKLINTLLATDKKATPSTIPLTYKNERQK